MQKLSFLQRLDGSLGRYKFTKVLFNSVVDKKRVAKLIEYVAKVTQFTQGAATRVAAP